MPECEVKSKERQKWPHIVDRITNRVIVASMQLDVTQNANVCKRISVLHCSHSSLTTLSCTHIKWARTRKAR
jgi:hypothetical protein